jgi:hypothetical protein
MRKIYNFDNFTNMHNAVAAIKAALPSSIKVNEINEGGKVEIYFRADLGNGEVNIGQLHGQNVNESGKLTFSPGTSRHKATIESIVHDKATDFGGKLPERSMAKAGSKG